jgi:hypothetical protein
MRARRLDVTSHDPAAVGAADDFATQRRTDAAAYFKRMTADKSRTPLDRALAN